jgi:hypothetical protein
MKPPCAVEFPVCAEVAISATIGTAGTNSFQQTASMLISARQRTPMTLILQKSKRSVPATKQPGTVSTGRPPETVVSEETPNNQPAPMTDPRTRKGGRTSQYRAAAFAPRAREQPPMVARVRPSLDPFRCGRPEIYSGMLRSWPIYARVTTSETSLRLSRRFRRSDDLVSATGTRECENERPVPKSAPPR